MKWFNTTGNVPEIGAYQIVEVEKPRPITDPEYKNSVPSLAGHPGFIYLMSKLKLERAKLLKYLTEERHADIRSVEFIQSGLFWTDWLEKQVSAARSEPKQLTVANDFETAAFQNADAVLELVGSKDPHKG